MTPNRGHRAVLIVYAALVLVAMTIGWLGFS
jgi:hypothetical protein